MPRTWMLPLKRTRRFVSFGARKRESDGRRRCKAIGWSVLEWEASGPRAAGRALFSERFGESRHSSIGRRRRSFRRCPRRKPSHRSSQRSTCIRSQNECSRNPPGSRWFHRSSRLRRCTSRPPADSIFRPYRVFRYSNRNRCCTHYLRRRSTSRRCRSCPSSSSSPTGSSLPSSHIAYQGPSACRRQGRGSRRLQTHHRRRSWSFPTSRRRPWEWQRKHSSRNASLWTPA
jgi:hypothetical protein